MSNAFEYEKIYKEKFNIQKADLGIEKEKYMQLSADIKAKDLEFKLREEKLKNREAEIREVELRASQERQRNDELTKAFRNMDEFERQRL